MEMRILQHKVQINCISVYCVFNATLCIKQQNPVQCVGPTAETVTDFWQMISDIRPAVIVMLTKVIENEKVRLTRNAQ